jgi:hypothetical protein
MSKPKQKPPAPRNPMARELEQTQFRRRVLKSKKLYKRKRPSENNPEGLSDSSEPISSLVPLLVPCFERL